MMKRSGLPRTMYCLAFAVLWLGTVSSANTITIPAGFTWSLTPAPAVFETTAGKVNMSDLSIVNTHAFDLPQAGQSPLVISDFTVTGEIGLDGLAPLPVTGGISIEFDPLTAISGGGEENPTESLSLVIIGPPLPGPTAPIIIRNNPSLQSVGRTSATDTGGGNFTINSFFDVFTELSLDSGATWTPADNALTLANPAPLPSCCWAGLALLACLGFAKLDRKKAWLVRR